MLGKNYKHNTIVVAIIRRLQITDLDSIKTSLLIPLIAAKVYWTYLTSFLSECIYDKTFTEPFKDKLEMVQYNAALVLTGAFKVTSRDRIYRELGLKSLAERRWSRKIFLFQKIINGILPVYLQSYISYCDEGVYRTRSANQKNLRQFSASTKIFESSFFLYCIKE